MTSHSITKNKKKAIYGESDTKRREFLTRGGAVAALVATGACFLQAVSPAFAAEKALERGTPEQAKAIVAQAIVLYDENGAQAAFQRFNKNPPPTLQFLDLYIFVMDATDGKLAAHALAPSIVGMDAREFIDPDGLNIGQAIMDAASPDGAWVDYQSIDPSTGEVIPKSSWVVLHDGYIFGCGIHPQ